MKAPLSRRRAGKKQPAARIRGNRRHLGRGISRIIERSYRKQDVTIHIDPTLAVIAIDLLRSHFREMIERIESEGRLHFDRAHRHRLLEILEEINDRCAVKTGVLEVAAAYSRLRRIASRSGADSGLPSRTPRPMHRFGRFDTEARDDAPEDRTGCSGT